MTLWEQLQGRQLPTAPVSLPAVPDSYAAAERELDAATQALHAAQVRGADPPAFRERVERAQAALDGQPVLQLTVRCLPPTEWEDLVEAHPPTEEQLAKGWQWNLAEFRPALLAVAVVPPDGSPALTEQQWRSLADGGQVAVGELDLIFGTTVNLNVRAPQVSTGKGSPGTPS